jgi:hypothetical protein
VTGIPDVRCQRVKPSEDRGEEEEIIMKLTVGN